MPRRRTRAADTWDGAFLVEAMTQSPDPEMRRFIVTEQEPEVRRACQRRGVPFTMARQRGTVVDVEIDAIRQAAVLMLAGSGFAAANRGSEGLSRLTKAERGTLEEKAGKRLAEIKGAAILRSTRLPRPARARPQRRGAR